MPITSHLSADGSELNIVVVGSFDFSQQQQFRRCYETLAVTPKRYRIDMHEATRLDNSALGMLLMLREHAGGDASNVAIANCGAEILSALKRSKFEHLFAIS